MVQRRGCVGCVVLQCAKDETDAADYFKHIREYVASDFHDKDSKFGEPLFIVRSGIRCV